MQLGDRIITDVTKKYGPFVFLSERVLPGFVTINRNGETTEINIPGENISRQRLPLATTFYIGKNTTIPGLENNLKHRVTENIFSLPKSARIGGYYPDAVGYWIRQENPGKLTNSWREVETVCLEFEIKNLLWTLRYTTNPQIHATHEALGGEKTIVPHPNNNTSSYFTITKRDPSKIAFETLI